jgi:pyruvate/2-oxoglutarate dehydrogenase complex dihydrolipoamide dehydrogenase (E3) component
VGAAPGDDEADAAEQLVTDEAIGELHLGTALSGIADDHVMLDGGASSLPADLVVLSVGVRPESSLARDAGLELDTRGYIVVDAEQRTSDPSIYAVGDAVVKQRFDGDPSPVWLAGLANRHGRLAADVIAGRPHAAVPALGTAVIGLFGLTAAAVGRSERELRDEGRAIRVIHTHPTNHAGYYPGAEQLSLKLMVDAETDAILGAQAVGGGVERGDAGGQGGVLALDRLGHGGELAGEIGQPGFECCQRIGAGGFHLAHLPQAFGPVAQAVQPHAEHVDEPL